MREGVLLMKTGGTWVKREVVNDEHIQVGYNHILATDLNKAIGIAKENSEFVYVPTASIEMRPVKTKEPETGFVYPAKK